MSGCQQCWDVWQHSNSQILLIKAKYTVRVSKLLFRNCVQAHDNILEVLRHIILYLSKRRPQSTGNPGHAGPGFFEHPYFQEFCLSRPKNFQNSTIIITKNSRGSAPHPPPYGAAPLPPTEAGAKCLATVMLAHHDRAFSLNRACMSEPEAEHKFMSAGQYWQIHKYIYTYICWSSPACPNANSGPKKGPKSVFDCRLVTEKI